MFRFKSAYVGDNSNTVNLIDMMSVPSGVVRDKVELQTAAEPYGVVISYRVKNIDEVMVDGAVTDEYFYKNSILMFALIGNLDTITINMIDDGGQYDGAVYSFNHTRQVADRYMGNDVRLLAETNDKFARFLEVLQAFDRSAWNKNNSDSSPAISEELADKIERNIQFIISSPQSASNPYSYIRTHENEFEDILKMETADGQVLKYLLNEFAEGNTEGLRGHILKALSVELLGDRNNVPEGIYGTPDEWYAQLKPYPIRTLPKYKHTTGDQIERIVYTLALAKVERDYGHHEQPEEGVWIVAPTIYGVYEDSESNEIKIYASIYSVRYKLYGDTLYESGGSRIPTMLHVRLPKGADGFVDSSDLSIELLDYVQAKDGSEFTKSIKEFSSGYDGIAKEILEDRDKGYLEIMEKNINDYVRMNHLDAHYYERGNEKIPLRNVSME